MSHVHVNSNASCVYCDIYRLCECNWSQKNHFKCEYLNKNYVHVNSFPPLYTDFYCIKKLWPAIYIK